jgi:hypothetical protein
MWFCLFTVILTICPPAFLSDSLFLPSSLRPSVCRTGPSRPVSCLSLCPSVSSSVVCLPFFLPVFCSLSLFLVSLILPPYLAFLSDCLTSCLPVCPPFCLPVGLPRLSCLSVGRLAFLSVCGPSVGLPSCFLSLGRSACTFLFA